MRLDHLLPRTSNQTARKRASSSGRFGSAADAHHFAQRLKKVDERCPGKTDGSCQLNRCQVIPPQRKISMGNFFGNTPTAERKRLIPETNLRSFE